MGGLAALRVVVFCYWVLPAAGWDELTTLRQRASWRVKAASAGGGWCCGLVLGGRRPGSAGAGVSARGLGSRGEEVGGGSVVYPGVRRAAAEAGARVGRKGCWVQGGGAPLQPAAGGWWDVWPR